MSRYYEWEGFTDIYLEDSFVLGIDESDNTISFIIEVVLTEKHPLYTSPKENEQYCYNKGKIVFQNLKSVEWLHRNEQPFTDADDSEDYGNIDTFELSEEGYGISGDWGELRVISSPVKLIWTNDSL